ncbi:trypco2 family protein [Streptomyces collinus]|uniref:trypco2 family protein n=1 Tax=Streptomyces collinus TaxID=42684 RepID=UPI00380D0818
MANADTADEDGLDLADAITQLRGQIAEAQKRIADPDGAGDQGVRFKLDEVTLELGMELTRTRGVNGGLRFSVVSLGGKRESADKATHKVTVRLNPRRPGGGDIDIDDAL